MGRLELPDIFFTADEVAASLLPIQWQKYRRRRVR